MSLALSGISPRTRSSKCVISVPAIDDAYVLVGPSVHHPNVTDAEPNMASPSTGPTITILDTKPPAVTISPPSPQSVIRTCPPTPVSSPLQPRNLLPAQPDLLAAPLPLRLRRQVFGSEGKDNTAKEKGRDKENSNSPFMDAKDWQKRRDAKARGKLIMTELANLKVKYHSMVERHATLLAQHTMLQDEHGVLEGQHDGVRDMLALLQNKYKWLFREYCDLAQEQTKLQIVVMRQEKEIERLKMLYEDQLALKKGKRKKRRDWAAWWAEWKRGMGFA